MNRSALAACTALLFLAPPAAATCVPRKTFTSFDELYSYVVLPPEADASPTGVVGRFWQPGARAGANEGTYDDSNWFLITPGRPDYHYLNGYLDDPRAAGCPSGALITTIETTSEFGENAVFAALRVDETPAGFSNFDYARIGRDMPVRPFPALTVTGSARGEDGTILLDLAFDDVGDGFFGTAGMLPQGTITAYRVYERYQAAGHPAPGRTASDWTLRRVVPYLGTAPSTEDLQVDCSVPGQTLWLATGLEFDDGQVVGAYVGRGKAIICQTCLDGDLDGVCDEADNCIPVPNPTQANADGDARGDACDNCPAVANDGQEDAELDGAGDACDNCLTDPNASQADLDADGQGDRCDLDDGLIYIFSIVPDYSEWQAEAGYSSWNSYKGSLAVLRASGEYTQAPGSDPLAARQCGLTEPRAFDPVAPDPSETAFYLTTGESGGLESGLGTDGAGTPRPNTNPCP